MYSVLPFGLLLACLNLVTAQHVVPPEDYLSYDTGSYGRVPTTKVRSTKSVASRLHRRVWNKQCDQPDQYHFIAPHGILLGHAGPEILDNDGNQVWFDKRYRTTYNFRAQSYRGEQYLTWWSGNDQVKGHGSGYYYMLDKHYQVYKKIGAIGENLMADLHEFVITPQNTALLTVYDTIAWNLTDWGIADSLGWGYIRDGMFQEIDLESNELLFEWRASEHITLEECFTRPNGEGKTFDNAWDWFHINSVDKDKKGNYLISSRYAHALFYIDGKTGDIIWRIGGKKNDFEDLSDGRVVSISRQHHATWTDNGASIIVFDNSERAGNMSIVSRGLKIAVDQEKMTVEALADASHPMGYYAASQGSIQQLDNGNLLVGWGYAPAFTEFSPDGTEVICDHQFGALHSNPNGSFSPGAAESYRAYKGTWQGFPLDNPNVVFGKDGVFYVSWNGATELRTWNIEGTDGFGTHDDDWQFIEEFPRTGFESNATVDGDSFRLFRLTALDKNGLTLGSWVVLNSGEVKALPTYTPPTPRQSTTWTILVFLLGACATLVLVYLRRPRHILRIPLTPNLSKAYSDDPDNEQDSGFWHRVHKSWTTRLGSSMEEQRSDGLGLVSGEEKGTRCN